MLISSASRPMRRSASETRLTYTFERPEDSSGDGRDALPLHIDVVRDKVAALEGLATPVGFCCGCSMRRVQRPDETQVHTMQGRVGLGWATVMHITARFDTDAQGAVRDNRIELRPSWWAAWVGAAVGHLGGFEMPQLEAQVTGFDRHGRALLSGAAAGFVYHPLEGIDTLLGWEGYERTDVWGECVSFARWSPEQGAQSLRYQGPFVHGISSGKATFANFPLAVVARLALGTVSPL